MAVAVDPRPAQLPLPGGREHATVTVAPLLAGEINAPPRFFDRRPGRLSVIRTLLARRSRWIWLPIPAFLVRHPGVGAMLVDTGLHPSVANDPKHNLGFLGRVQRIRMDSEQALERQLDKRDLEPTDIRVVVMTHLHFDHASGVSEFPDATFVVDRHEWHEATHQGILHGYVHRNIDHAFEWRTIDFDDTSINSFATFGRAVDLFGDGSVRLLSTPGHSDGHMSVLLRLANRDLLLTGDACYSMRSLTEDLTPLFVEDLHVYRRSLSEIRGYRKQAPDAVVIPGHDPDTWPKLESLYR